MTPRRFPPPWRTDKIPGGYVVRDTNGQALAYICSRDSEAEAMQAKAGGIVGVNVAVSNHVWGEHATEFLATGTSIRRLAAEHRLPATSPKPAFTLGLDF